MCNKKVCGSFDNFNRKCSPFSSVPFNDAAYKGKQMLPGGSKTRSALQVCIVACCRNLHMQWVSCSVPSKKILHWANVCFSAHAMRNNVDTQAVKRFKRYNGYAVHIRYQICNVASVRECDFTVQIVWRAVAHQGTLEGTLVSWDIVLSVR